MTPSLWPEIRIAAECLLLCFSVASAGVSIPAHKQEGHYKWHFENCLNGGGFKKGGMMYFCNPVITRKWDSVFLEDYFK